MDLVTVLEELDSSASSFTDRAIEMQCWIQNSHPLPPQPQRHPTWTSVEGKPLPLYESDIQRWLDCLATFDWDKSPNTTELKLDLPKPRPSLFFEGGCRQQHPITPAIRQHPLQPRMTSIECNYYGLPSPGSKVQRLTKLAKLINSDDELSNKLIRNSLKLITLPKLDCASVDLNSFN